MQRILALTRPMLPAYAANMAPPFSLCWPGRGRQISQRWLCSRKTWKVSASAIVGAIAGKLLERRLDCLAMRSGHGPSLWPGTTLGDSAKSFVRRQLGNSADQRWLPADHLDCVLGGLLTLGFWVELRGLAVLFEVALSFAAAVLANRAVYAIGVKGVPW